MESKNEQTGSYLPNLKKKARKSYMIISNPVHSSNGGGAVASWLVRSTPERVLRVRALAGDIVFLGKTLHPHSASLHPGV